MSILKGSFLDLDWKPKREFWPSMWIPNECPKCGYKMNGVTYKWKLLCEPQDCECNNCGARWSVAIEKGPSIARNEIENLLSAERDFYRLRKELVSVMKILDVNL